MSKGMNDFNTLDRITKLLANLHSINRMSVHLSTYLPAKGSSLLWLNMISISISSAISEVEHFSYVY